MAATDTLVWAGEDIIVGLIAFTEVSNGLISAGMPTQDAYNETMDHFCRQAGGRLNRVSDAVLGDDGFAHAYGWRVDD